MNDEQYYQAESQCYYKHFLDSLNDMIMEIEEDISAIDELVYDEV